MLVRFIIDIWDKGTLEIKSYQTPKYEFPDDGGWTLANAIARFGARYAQDPQVTATGGWPEVSTEIPPPIMDKLITPGMKFIIKSVERMN